MRGKKNPARQMKEHDHSIYLDYPYLEMAKKTMVLPDNPKRVLVAGDLHGSLLQIAYLIEQADKFDCDVIVQLGDFGYMPHVNPNYVKQAGAWLKEDGKTLICIDGNHENFAALNSPHPNFNQFNVLGEQILYAPRGTTWEWQGKKFLTLGGAYSIDKRIRRMEEQMTKEPHQKSRWRWWEEELLTDEDIEKAKETGEADIILAHDCPESVLLDQRIMWKEMEKETIANRNKVQQVIDSAKPSLVFHGHYHHRYSDVGGYKDNPFQVEGIGRDGMGEASYQVLDLTQELKRPKPRFSFDS